MCPPAIYEPTNSNVCGSDSSVSTNVSSSQSSAKSTATSKKSIVEELDCVVEDCNARAVEELRGVLSHDDCSQSNWNIKSEVSVETQTGDETSSRGDESMASYEEREDEITKPSVLGNTKGIAAITSLVLLFRWIKVWYKTDEIGNAYIGRLTSDSRTSGILIALLTFLSVSYTHLTLPTICSV